MCLHSTIDCIVNIIIIMIFTLQLVTPIHECERPASERRSNSQQARARKQGGKSLLLRSRSGKASLIVSTNRCRGYGVTFAKTTVDL